MRKKRQSSWQCRLTLLGPTSVKGASNVGEIEPSSRVKSYLSTRNDININI